MRTSGILLPVTSLPSEYGIGAMDQCAYDFVDFLERSGQTYWQILPLLQTSYGDSPYQSFSTFAGNPYLISLPELIRQGLLTKQECDCCDFGGDSTHIDYGKLYQFRFPLLKKAYQRSNIKNQQDFICFFEEQKEWLDDYALFMAVKNQHNGNSFLEWEEDIRKREEKAVKKCRTELEEDYYFYCYLQYEFFRQWKQLKAYANEKGILILGDIPIYVALDSADVWANPELFQLDEKGMPSDVAGCPPDGFSATGQLWGNPLYRWEQHKETGYVWWIKRMRACFSVYDILRIDHFRGFDEYYAIPYGEKTAVNGSWKKGPGFSLFQAFNQALGEKPIIAEDLGFLTDTVKELLEKTGYPGMKVLQFAFDSREESDYLPHNYTRNCIVYTGTHDNDTLLGWYQSISEADRKIAQDYLNNPYTPLEKIGWDYIYMAMRSVADYCVIPIQDYLELSSEARINIPSTLGENWKWRMGKTALTTELEGKIKRVTKLNGRFRHLE